MAENITKPSKGLNTDYSYEDQPKETYSFALNAVVESDDGDFNVLSVEEANEICASFPVGYTPIGKVYIGSGETAIFLVKDDGTASEIGVTDDDCNYVTYVNDLAQVDKLGFDIEYQVDATYRLRRGCERTLYFVDNLNFPRYYNLDKPEEFKTGGDWDVEKFKLFKTSNQVPTFVNIIPTTGGSLLAGSYNFSIQYLDEDLNPTEWITTSDTTIIYNNNTESKEFSEVRGSTNKKSVHQDFGPTSKAIEITLGNLNTAFPYYRIAVVEATNGIGEISRVLFSTEQSTSNPIFSHNGEIENYTIGTKEEIAQFSTVIENAAHIEQIENRLVLGNTQGKKINYCELQKYASKMTADVVYKNVILDSITTDSNPKRGQLHTESVGYMPGEIYSFGIVYLFGDGTTSPVYHIPGKAPGATSGMSSDNSLVNTTYVDNDSCAENVYWGLDSQGAAMEGALVRHHRFPTRAAAVKPLVTRTELGAPGGGDGTDYELRLDITGEIDPGEARDPIIYRVTYSRDGFSPLYYTGIVDVTNYNAGEVGGVNPAYQDLLIVSDPLILQGIITLEYYAGDILASPQDLTYTVRAVTGSGESSFVDDAEYYADIFGIEFSNIDKPTLVDTGGEDVVGYYIVRNERTESNKTILDTGVLAPLLSERGGSGTKFVSHGHIMPTSSDMKDDTFALIHPEHKFNNKEYTNVTSYVQEGKYDMTTRNFSTLLTQDVMPGTSYDSSVNKNREKDSDGFTLNTSLRNNNVEYVTVTSNELIPEVNLEETFYLDTLYSKTITDVAAERKSIYNLSADNKIGIVQMNAVLPLSNVTDSLPYVIMKRDLNDPYANFRNSTYYKENTNSFSFVTDTNNTSDEIYNGDVYISSMKYISTMMYAMRMRKRGTKTGIFNFILGTLAIIAGVLVTVGTLGLGTAAGIALIGFGVTQIATGLEKEQLSKVYGDLYDQGLENTVDDDDTADIFDEGTAIEDDEIQWFQDSVTNLWFESSVNMNWRMGNTIGLTDFLNSPSGYDQNQYKSYALEKVTALDSKADGGRTYQGFAKAELYELNKDYLRRDREKKYFHLGLEYDCCSDCNEEFPHRVNYSEQSFQEELTDNYRTFLPNNYRDIEGETGEVTNIFRIQNNLYIHTKEALWHLPQNLQERVTGDILSFIGTGSFFSIPPRKIVDDDTGHSGGTEHKWGIVKTPYGVFFPSERQRTLFKFDGNKLDPISERGNSNWFKNNMLIQGNYVKNNPSNILGSGFITTYDSRKERVIFTKKDTITGAPDLDNSWTISYSMKMNSWTSWHSYQPSFYIQTPNKFYSWNQGSEDIFKHNAEGKYQNFYGAKYPFIVEYVSVSNPIVTRVWDSLKIDTDAEKYNATTEEFVDERFVTFTKAVAYNSRQCTGLMTLEPKDTAANQADYLKNQVVNSNDNVIPIDRNERQWTLNDLRDIRTDYTNSIWDSSLDSVQNEYYIDKILNTSTMDVTKDWTQLESFRDKYLVIRLIFDTFDDIKLIFNHSVENEQQSF